MRRAFTTGGNEDPFLPEILRAIRNMKNASNAVKELPYLFSNFAKEFYSKRFGTWYMMMECGVT